MIHIHQVLINGKECTLRQAREYLMSFANQGYFDPDEVYPMFVSLMHSSDMEFSEFIASELEGLDPTSGLEFILS